MQYQSNAVVRDRDLGLGAILKEIEKLARSHVIIGFPDGTLTHAQTRRGRRKAAGQSLAQIAFENEFGTSSFPARPFMRPSFDQNIQLLTRVIDREYTRIVNGRRTVRRSLEALGLLMQNLIKQRIRAIHQPPNSPYTIAIKRSSKPLIDFGQMIGAVQYRVVIR